MKDEIQAKLIAYTAEALRVEPSALSGDTNIKTDVDLKSLEMSAIISKLEEEYDCYIKYTELMHADTISEAAEVISKSIQ